VVFGLVVLVLLLMAIGYNNNLIYIYTFSLASASFVTMYFTNRNVEVLNFQSLSSETLFAGEEGEVKVRLQNSSSWRVQDAHLNFEKSKSFSKFEVDPQESPFQTVTLYWGPQERGYVEPPKVVLSSDFPIQIFRSWKVFRSKDPLLVFPRRVGEWEYPMGLQDREVMNQMGLFRDHREYQSTDSPQKMDWKASAKTQQLLVKNFEGEEEQSLNFEWRHTKDLLDFEKRISQLSLWVDRAEKEGRRYSLTTPHFKSGEGQGAHHMKKCLGHLALLSLEDVQ
tara:strand:+ start:4551 stop:5393 length:843 start_codon:yes stop_codon:yes gene_type:complete